ncbi:ABC transporter ATP-binding protein [Ruminococcus sp.]|jgi:ATP-binding cassette subfamily B multidrug efflux pump|uniref:ABC transporter ATP-binding protein n=1 Tax=Ruminococcus sp. TaxID=41978 RepID=UPI000E3F3E36|nr:ABC transporter ATP-binding protein [Lachnospiraceae bacterium AM25-22]RGD07676.1 ABC transporter ATP-binding protein [Lachnospiraceae bacterium AM25-11LB]RJW07016.1 ABC transporter ATP-binding protein [Lachnospiraceae bacterium AM25-40]RJW13173.1 ABC transporter ATP-binding protein [Lachnospiraceae bacterium AM25-39]HBE9655955.1 ABC transporter ATP-binding protein [Clostridioides difficile]
MAKKKTNLSRVIPRLLSYIILRHKLIFGIVVICILISSCTVVASSLFLEILIDNYIEPLLLENTPVFSGLLHTVLFMAVVYIIGVFSTLAYNRLMVKISQGTLKQIRDDMFSHMQELPIGYFDTHTHGDIMSHYTNDTDTLRQFISQALPQFISAVITIIAILISMIISNIPLTILVVIFTLLMVFVTNKIGGASAKYFIKQQETLGSVTGYIEEMINGQKVIKVFCHEEKAKQGFDKKNKQLYEDSALANKYGNILMPTIMQLGNLQYVLIALVGGYMAISGIGSVTVGMIVAFLNLSKTFCIPISQISQQISLMAMAFAGAERIFDLIDEEPEQDNGYVTLTKIRYNNGLVEETNDTTGIWAWKHPHHDGTLTYTELHGEIEFFDVDFGYTKEKLVLHNIALNATSGQKIAFVGATGAGKTTITNLINRFYDLVDGKIRYDGININKIRKSDLRRSLGVVLQDVNLFTGTIMDNIRYGNLNATDEECIKASKLSNADKFIRHLPEGYQTMLTQNGASLSQGQRQLLSIARATVANPPVMILDEATSSIDTRTEALVQQGMDNLMKGRTTFVIAHRLSTVRNSDTIIVLDLGRIIERGTHNELIQKHGVYYSLYTGAFELE